MQTSSYPAGGAPAGGSHSETFLGGPGAPTQPVKAKSVALEPFPDRFRAEIERAAYAKEGHARLLDQVKSKISHLKFIF